MAGRTKDPLDVWSHADHHEIELPSGAGKATYRSLDLIDFVAFGNGDVPNPLRVIALKAEAGEFEPSEATDEELQNWSNLKCGAVARAVEKFNDKQVQLTPEWVRDSMPKEDRDRLFAGATHVLLPQQARGLMAFASFREELTGLLASKDRDGDGKVAE